MSGDYLWDRSGEPDAEVQRLEALLARYRHEAPRPVRRRSRMLRQAALVAAAVVLLCGSFGAWLLLLPRFGAPGNVWRVERLAGAPRVIDQKAPRDGLALGETLVTDAGARALVRAGRVGRIEVEPGSSLSLVRNDDGRRRLKLVHGKISARFFAPPFTFAIETPAAIAFDVGCAFDLEADQSQTALHVSSGWVSLQAGARHSLVPAGASAVALAGQGPGTPFFDDASDAFKSALRALDFGGADARAVALRDLLAAARARDVYSLLVLARSAGEVERGVLFDRASALVPPPAGLTRARFVERDEALEDAWMDALHLGRAKRWWANWRDAL